MRVWMDLILILFYFNKKIAEKTQMGLELASNQFILYLKYTFEMILLTTSPTMIS